MRPGAVGLYLFVFVMAVGALLDQGGVRVVLAAMDADEVLDDPVLESRARALSKELRCLVCQNQSIDDSNADLARDLRRLVRERLIAGDSDEDIIAFATDRYGDFVLLRPPMKPSTWALWYGPPAIFVIAAIGLVSYMRRRRHEPAVAPIDDLSADEQARLDRLLDKKSPDPT